MWGPTHSTDTHYLRIYMKQLRDKLEKDSLRPRHLLTETGVGYRLAVDDQASAWALECCCPRCIRQRGNDRASPGTLSPLALPDQSFQ